MIVILRVRVHLRETTTPEWPEHVVSSKQLVWSRVAGAVVLQK